ncbi:hypothetical protein C8Q78DRAFT_961710 [Trametes maxima]|nr:hypothetical protein C8Q78DRAFT_961710 [Trametes maxima]
MSPLGPHPAIPHAATHCRFVSKIQELQLLNLDKNLTEATGDHEVITAPLLTREAYTAVGLHTKQSPYGVLGSLTAIRDAKAGNSFTPRDPRLYINTNAPFSAIVCGVQGSGKSHTVAVLLEDMLIAGYAPIGTSGKPLSGLVLHFGEGGSDSRACEAAWIGQTKIEGVRPPVIKVYGSGPSLAALKDTYAALGPTVSVEPLLFSEKELDAEAVLSMMAVGSSDVAPLYMQRILADLRDLGGMFTYTAFLKKVKQAKIDMTSMQVGYLEQRMALLDRFVDTGRDQSKERFKPGQLTIIDLSDPFIDAGSACALFEIVTRLFVRAEVDTGKVLVVDEAHKYLSMNKGRVGLTKALTSLTRQQRHLALRVIISTQEPTALPPVLIDLCSIAILHRFSSPAWWDAIVKHVSADFEDYDAFDHVVRLKTGKAVVLAPAGLGKFPISLKGSDEESGLASFGRRYLLVRTRRRITTDGGASRMVASV